MKKKRSIAGRLGVAALALTLVTASLASGTLAKYTTTYNVGADVIVARWNVGATLYDEDGTPMSGYATTDAVNVNTSESILSLADTMWVKEWNPNGGENEGRYVKVSNGRVAPGTEGFFGIKMDPTNGTSNSTEVALKYSLEFKQLGTPATTGAVAGSIPKNLTFQRVDGVPTNKEGFTPHPDSDAITIADTDTNFHNLTTGFYAPNTQAGDAETVWVHWEWPYETGIDSAAISSNDGLDTNSGKTGASIRLLFVAKFTQINPFAEAVSETEEGYDEFADAQKYNTWYDEKYPTGS